MEFDGDDESTDLENMMELAWNDSGVVPPLGLPPKYRQDGRAGGMGIWRISWGIFGHQYNESASLGNN